jgi:hypothetical protein
MTYDKARAAYLKRKEVYERSDEFCNLVLKSKDYMDEQFLGLRGKSLAQVLELFRATKEELKNAPVKLYHDGDLLDLGARIEDLNLGVGRCPPCLYFLIEGGVGYRLGDCMVFTKLWAEMVPDTTT